MNRIVLIAVLVAVSSIAVESTSYSVLLRAYVFGTQSPAPTASSMTAKDYIAGATSCCQYPPNFPTAYNSALNAFEWTMNNYSINTENFQIMSSSSTGYPFSRVEVTYIDPANGCPAGTTFDVLKTSSGLATNVINSLSTRRYWTGAVTSTYTTFPVTLQVDNCTVSNLRVTLIAANGAQYSQSQAVSAPYHASYTTTPVNYNINVGTNNQITDVKVDLLGSTPGTCAVVAVKVETAPNVFPCAYHSMTPAVFGTPLPNAWSNVGRFFFMSTSGLTDLQMKCVINANYC